MSWITNGGYQLSVIGYQNFGWPRSARLVENWRRSTSRRQTLRMAIALAKKRAG
jgi:hypothetical protein